MWRGGCGRKGKDVFFSGPQMTKPVEKAHKCTASRIENRITPIEPVMLIRGSWHGAAEDNNFGVDSVGQPDRPFPIVCASLSLTLHFVLKYFRGPLTVVHSPLRRDCKTSHGFVGEAREGASHVDRFHLKNKNERIIYITKLVA